MSSTAAKLERLHKTLVDHAYSLTTRLDLVLCYEKLDYPDLACAEAYRTILLIDEVLDETAEFHDIALSGCAWADERDTGIRRKPASDVSEADLVDWVRRSCQEEAYQALIKNLVACGCLKDAVEHASRASKIFSSAEWSELPRQCYEADAQSDLADAVSNISITDSKDLPNRVMVRRELYPWNDHEPDRFGSPTLTWLNDHMSKVAPNLEVRVTELPLLVSHHDEAIDTRARMQQATVLQLGVFSKKNIAPGEVMLQEKSILTAQSRLHDSFCDACGVPLAAELPHGEDLDANVCAASCDDCDVCFCSQECFRLASEAYHPAVCDTDVEIAASDATAAESADALYSLLLLRSLAMAETQDKHPLDLTEVRYIWGDYTIAPQTDTTAYWDLPRTLPFSFKYNVLLPLQMLEKMNVNIFEQSAKYDFWVFNTLYAKFRGTASARQSLDGKPETAAVHPFWCLANHSCDPNVAWDWRGSMKFTARKERVVWTGKTTAQSAGIAKGEEIFGHYCDIQLPVQERREWAVGALGGDCMCERCRWEAVAPAA